MWTKRITVTVFVRSNDRICYDEKVHLVEVTVEAAASPPAAAAITVFSLSLSTFLGCLSRRPTDKPTKRPIDSGLDLPWVIKTKSALFVTQFLLHRLYASEFTRAQQIGLHMRYGAIAMNDDRWFSYVCFVHCRTLWLFKWLSLGFLPSNTTKRIH